MRENFPRLFPAQKRVPFPASEWSMNVNKIPVEGRPADCVKALEAGISNDMTAERIWRKLST